MVSTAQKLQYLHPASVPLVDWVVTNDGKQGSPDVIDYWNPALGPQPTQAELDAITEQQVIDARDAAFAQEEKAEATKGVDDALTKQGGRSERGIMSVAYSISKAENNTRLALFQVGNAIRDATTFADLKTRVAAINFPAEVTPQQVATAVKAAIAETPE